MKIRLGAFIVALTLFFGLCACGPGGAANNANNANNTNSPNAADNTSNETKPSETVDETPYLLFEGVKYYANGVPTQYLPYSYGKAGELTTEQAGNSGLSGIPYYISFNNDDLYTYMETGTPVGDNTVDTTKRQFAYVRWIPESMDPILERKLTIDEVLLLSGKGMDLKWEDLEYYKYTVGGGGGVFFTDEGLSSETNARYFLLGQHWVLVVVVDKELNIGSAKLHYLSTYNNYAGEIDIRTEDVESFIKTHSITNIIDKNENQGDDLQYFCTHYLSYNNQYSACELDLYLKGSDGSGLYAVFGDGRELPLKEALEKNLIYISDVPGLGLDIYIDGKKLEGLPAVPRADVMRAHPLLTGWDQWVSMEKGMTVFYSKACGFGVITGKNGDISWEDYLDCCNVEHLTETEIRTFVNRRSIGDIPDRMVVLKPLIDTVNDPRPAEEQEKEAKEVLERVFHGRYKTGKAIYPTGEMPDEAEKAAKQKTMEELQAKYPHYFSLDLYTAKPSRIFVVQLAEDKFECGIVPHLLTPEKMLLDISVTQQLAGMTCTPEEMQIIIDSYHLADSYVVLTAYYTPYTAFTVKNRAAFEKTVAGLFGGRYKVDNNMQSPFISGWSLEYAKDQDPALFDIDTTNGLTVWVSEASGFGLSAGKDSKTIDISKRGVDKPVLSLTTIKFVLDWYKENKGIEDSDIVIRPVHDALTDRIAAAASNYNSVLSEMFDGRYAVGD